MNKINPELLTRYRDRAGMSLEELSRRSGIDKGTINRIEKGKTKRSNAHTTNALAKALKVEAEALTATEVEPEAVENTLFSKTKLTMQISAESRNALSLVAARYSVKPSDIIEFAPLLFHLVASENLKQRAERLAELRAARDVVASLHGNFRHLAGRLVSDWQAEELEQLEERSIAGRDLRGDRIDDESTHTDARPYDYDDDDQNPFVEHLRARLAAVQGEGAEEQLEGWSPYFGPTYAICHDEARAYFCGDEDAADDLVGGRFSLTEIPKELRGDDKAQDRVAWATAKRQERAANIDDLLSPLGIGVLS